MTTILLAAFLLEAALAAPPEPDEVLPETWSVPSSGDSPQGPWWPDLGQPALSRAVDEGLSANRDLLAAHAQVRQAAAAASQAGSALSPSVSFDLSTNTAPTSSRGFTFGGLGSDEGAGVYHTGSARLNASWEVDLWGRNTLGWRASRLDARAAEGDVDAAAESLAWRITSAWLEVVAAREKAAVVRDQVQAQSELLEVVELRHRGGEATALEVLQQRQQLASSVALEPTWRAQERAGRWALALLLGRSATDQLDLPEALPEVPPSPALGAPSDLIDRRGELRSASARLDAARARRHQAERALLPTLRVSGSAGWQAYQQDELTTQQTWGVGTSASVPLFSGGEGWASVRGARSAEEAAHQDWASAMLAAVAEVEQAVILDQEQRLRLAAVREQEQAARLALDEAIARYREGVGSYQPVFTSLGAWQSARLSLVDAHLAALSDYVALRVALGGTWTPGAKP